MINLSEFQSSEQIGKGSYGKIYCVRWLKNNKLYALKKEILTDIETIEKRKEAWKIIQNFIKNTKCTGLINIYANLLLKNNIGTEYHYYELMERAERDWDQEINVRSQYNLYYKEYELLNILNQLISTLVLMQNNHITHRDIKPQNILVINGKYKLCDFGEIRVLKRNGLIVQRIRGSELYMSPILFKGLHSKLVQVKHNTYKSDVFSLGMCFFYASSLTYNGVDSIREVLDMNKIKEILFKFLGNKYSEKFILLILLMLEVNEEKRPDFIELEKKIRETFKF
jgi:serine/threonine protein kinase